MKKIICTTLALCIIFAFAACAKSNEEQDTTVSQTVTVTETTQTTTEPTPKTTAPAKEDSKKGESLKNTVISALGSQSGAAADGDFKNGSFNYKYIRNTEIVYANERSEAFEQTAKNNAQEFVDQIQTFYGDEITLYNTHETPIGDSDNGIDSVRYEYTYINTQNQLLKIFADSDGTISYVECNFTW